MPSPIAPGKVSSSPPLPKPPDPLVPSPVFAATPSPTSSPFSSLPSLLGTHPQVVSSSGPEAPPPSGVPSSPTPSPLVNVAPNHPPLPPPSKGMASSSRDGSSSAKGLLPNPSSVHRGALTKAGQKIINPHPRRQRVNIPLPMVSEEAKPWSSLFKAPVTHRVHTSLEFFTPTIDGATEGVKFTKVAAALPFNLIAPIASGATAPLTKAVRNLKAPLVSCVATQKVVSSGEDPQNADAIGAASKNEDSSGDANAATIDPSVPSSLEAEIVNSQEEYCPKLCSITAKSVEEFFPPEFMFDTPPEHSKGKPINLQVVLHPQQISMTPETTGLKQQSKRNKKVSKHTSNSLLDSSEQSGDLKQNKKKGKSQVSHQGSSKAKA
ncbi:hypothetical protein QJS10_CPA08g01666 [Acorus calamus]|uniref:Uncharacterized protein n=1 Tax=Acorus calamus TaxID=4465 RepID=A0AAV9EBN1_ACOCL|nr:hypothetical protein QJS10_CPA08g01666 [Acorus calamus]